MEDELKELLPLQSTQETDEDLLDIQQVISQSDRISSFLVQTLPQTPCHILPTTQCQTHLSSPTSPQKARYSPLPPDCPLHCLARENTIIFQPESKELDEDNYTAEEEEEEEEENLDSVEEGQCPWYSHVFVEHFV